MTPINTLGADRLESISWRKKADTAGLHIDRTVWAEFMSSTPLEELRWTQSLADADPSLQRRVGWERALGSLSAAGSSSKGITAKSTSTQVLKESDLKFGCHLNRPRTLSALESSPSQPA